MTSILLPASTSPFSGDVERADQRRSGSNLFFDVAEGLFGALGLDTAARNLRRYRSGEGGTRYYSDDEIEEHAPIKEAEDTNRSRFTAQTITGRTNNEALNEKLLTLKSGEEYEFKDTWKSSFKPFSDSLANPDTYLAFGRFDVRSDGKFKVLREGNELYVTGKVRHGFDEDNDENLFDFNEGQPGHGAAKDLEKVGAAAPYRMQFDRSQDLEAELEYGHDGRLHVKRAKWGALR